MRSLIFLMRKLTGNGHQIPLLYVTLDIDKYHESVEDSAECRFHPDFKDDEEYCRKIEDLLENKKAEGYVFQSE